MGIDWSAVTKEDLPDEYRDVADVIGLESALKLAQVYGGERVYVPTLRHVRREQLAHRAHTLLEDGKREHTVCRELGITRAKLNALVERSAKEE